MVNLYSKESINKMKFFVLMCGCLMAVTVYAVQSPLKSENTEVSEFSSSAQTSAMDLAKAKNCLACHSVATNGFGPAFKYVSAKYAGQKDALDKLTAKVMKGGSGNWGTKAMPANTQVTKAEATTLVRWILTLK